jgi:hypothetical protein
MKQKTSLDIKRSWSFATIQSYDDRKEIIRRVHQSKTDRISNYHGGGGTEKKYHKNYN